ncbi:1,4-beta-xylanase [Yeosuana marina]|uniref:1,4-beta-xylanase n=1 Tax=Yeosuana marina TaxID=1565536 RepID=UPI0030EFA295|tara:strand:+ start:4089 stop:5189 length:1101 start_codon:yes stop_codon:yes gene_type:complete
MKYQKIILVAIVCLVFSCSSVKKNALISNNNTEPTMAKFEPADGECLFFIGQDLRAVGGLDNYTDGYCDHFDVPAGVTVYTGFSSGAESFGYIQKGNDGIKTVANWGAEDNCAQYYLDDADFNHSMIAIGLSLVDNEKKTATGEHDHLIRELAEWIKASNRPVFLRVGYEFDGWDWNHYNKKDYLAAWKHIHAMFDDMNVTNVAFVWQSKGKGSNQDTLEAWYPGDDLVDWCAYSYFDNTDQEMLTFVRKHNKPVFIAEATPILYDGGLFFDTDLSKPNIAKEAWELWFIPFFNTLNQNKDVIKAFSYINVDWSVQPMWINNDLFKHVDSRIQESEFISKKWQEEISKPRYLKPSAELWVDLQNGR